MIKSVENKGELARTHIGIGAQTVKSIFEKNGLNAHDYGLFCYDSEDGENGIFGIRYSELLSFIVSAI